MKTELRDLEAAWILLKPYRSLCKIGINIETFEPLTGFFRYEIDESQAGAFPLENSTDLLAAARTVISIVQRHTACLQEQSNSSA